MTGSSGPSDPAIGDPPVTGSSGPARRPPGASIFSIEGRAAPGLYFVGWIGSVLGLAVFVVGLLSGGGPAGTALVGVGALVMTVGLVSAAGAQAIERRRTGSAYTGPSPFLVFAASLPLTILLVIVLIVPATALGLATSSPLAALISVVVTTLVYLALVRLLVVGPGALSWFDMGVGPFGRRALADLTSGILLAFPVVIVTSLLAAILVQFVGSTPESPLPPSGLGLGILVNLASASLVAPIGEEVFYRGFATTAWARTMGPRSALVRGAVFFALIHVLTVSGVTFGDAAGQALVAFAARLPVALALGWIFLQRRSIYASIGLHATFNGILVVLAELASRSVGG